jgi:TRAP-type uncharacterized transport system fused permease subunit
MIRFDYTDAILRFLWMAFVIYLGITWAFRFRTHRQALRFARQHIRRDPPSGLAELTRGSTALPSARHWTPSRTVEVAHLGLLLVPSLWGPVVTFSVMFGTDLDWGVRSMGSTGLGWALVLLSVIVAWFCHRARKSFGEIHRNTLETWRISAIGSGIVGAMIAGMLGMIREPGTVAPISTVCSYVTATGSVLLGLLLLYTSREIAWTRKAMMRSND